MSDFTDVKSQILSKMKNTEDCALYVYIFSSLNFLDLIKWSCGSFVWAYQDNIISDASIALIPNTDLNAYGIYKTNVSLTNPDNYAGCHDYTIDAEEGPDLVQELYFINSTSTVTISNNKRYKIILLGTSNVTINVSNNSNLDLQVYNTSQLNVTISSGVLNIDIRNNSNILITASGNSTVFGTTAGNSTTTYLGSNTSVGNFKSYIKSSINYTLSDTAIFNYLKFQKSVVINGGAP